jgi:hypothetical protein
MQGEKGQELKDSLQRLRAKSRDLQMRSAALRKRGTNLCRASYDASLAPVSELDLLRALDYFEDPHTSARDGEF